MAEEILQKEREHLEQQIHMRLEDYTHWWSYNSKRRNLLFFANIGGSLGAAIAGLFQQAALAGLCGALLTAVLAIQKYFPVDQEAVWYGVAVGRCKVLLNKARSPLATIESLTAIENDLNTLIGEEGEKTKTLGEIRKLPKP